VKGRDLDSYIEIKSGLTEGDKVIDGVSEEIKDGTKIKIL